jgi:hypothetical protein
MNGRVLSMISSPAELAEELDLQSLRPLYLQAIFDCVDEYKNRDRDEKLSLRLG